MNQSFINKKLRGERTFDSTLNPLPSFYSFLLPKKLGWFSQYPATRTRLYPVRKRGSWVRERGRRKRGMKMDTRDRRQVRAQKQPSPSGKSSRGRHSTWFTAQPRFFTFFQTPLGVLLTRAATRKNSPGPPSLMSSPSFNSSRIAISFSSQWCLPFLKVESILCLLFGLFEKVQKGDLGSFFYVCVVVVMSCCFVFF